MPNIELLEKSTPTAPIRIVALKTNVISDLNLKFSVENPWFWAANRDGLDPDRLGTGAYGGSAYLGDQPTYYSFTLNVKF